MDSENKKCKGIFIFKDVEEGLPDYFTIVKSIPDEVIYNFYLGFYPSISRKFKSPFKTEKDPSFCFFIKNGKVLFKCFSTGKAGDSVELVRTLYSIEYKDAVKKICADIKSLKVSNNTVKYKKLSATDTQKSVIEVILRDFQTYDYLYWNQYYITKELLEKYNIRACDEVWLNDKLYYKDSIGNPAYRFRSNNLCKIYAPYSKNKHLSNYDSNTIQGLDQLNYNNKTLIITKAYKDIVILSEHYNKSTIALNAEGNLIPDRILKYFRSKFENILCFYDNDEAGIKYMIRNKELYNIDYFYFNPDSPKDISDYVKKFGIIDIEEIKEDLIYSNEEIKKLI
jgi:hypothetical protein